MKRHLYFIMAAVLWVASGCSDDVSEAGPTTVPKDPCEAGSQSYCDASGKLVVCTEGNWVHSSCPQGTGCTDGDCAVVCHEDYVASCSEDGMQANTCEHGVVKTTPCKVGQVCTAGACKDYKPGDACDDAQFVNVCAADTGKLLECQSGSVVATNCDVLETCQNGKCQPAKTCDESFEPQCYDLTTQIVCKDGHEVAVLCPNNEICRSTSGECETSGGGVSCVETAYAPSCDGNGVQVICKDGVVTRVACAVGTTCQKGVCVAGGGEQTCDALTHPPKCDGNVLVTCVNGSLNERACGEHEKCEGGACRGIVEPGATCDDDFKPMCSDDGSLLVCVNHSVLKASCGQATCIDGQCIDKTCSDKDVPKCDAAGRVSTQCIDGKWKDIACNENQTCRDGVCVDTVSDGETCDPATTASTCSVDGKVIYCQPSDDASHGTVQMTTCEGDTFCSNGACVECVEAGYKDVCDGDKVVQCKDGKLETIHCTGDTFCSDGACVECDKTFVASCVDSSTQRTCKDGKIVTESCADNEMCLATSKSCQPKGNSCDATHPCDEHYACSAEGVCVFVPECTPSDESICADGRNVTLKCVAPGLYEETPCSDDQVCKNGACMGTQCDDDYGTKCNGSKIMVCVDGYIVSSYNCDTQFFYNACDDTRYESECVDGACIKCNSGTFGNTCYAISGDASQYALTCSDAHEFTYYKCEDNEQSLPHKGCVSKCGEGFTASCRDKHTLHTCSADGREVDIPCEYYEDCVGGKCVSRQGSACSPTSYAKACYDKSQTDGTNAVLEYCDETTGTVRMIYCPNTTSFCGTIDGEVDCYNTCTPETTNNFFCTYNETLRTASMATCASGVDVSGKAQHGAKRIISACDSNGVQVTCHFDEVNNAPTFDYNLCDYTSSGTCSATTNMCTLHEPCAGPSDSRCEGTVAKSCTYDLAVGRYVLMTTDCSDTLNTNCVTYTNHESNKVAVCNKAVDMGGLSVSTLGTCSADGKTLHKIVGFHIEKTSTETTVHSYARSFDCTNACTTSTNAGVTFAYCH